MLPSGARFAKHSETPAGPASSAQPSRQRPPNQLRTNEVDVRIDSARRHDFPFPRNHFRARAHHHPGRDAVHQAGVPRFADSDDPSAPDSNVGLDDSPVVYDHRVRDDQIERAVGGRRGRRLPHSIAKDFASAEFRFFAGSREIALGNARRFLRGCLEIPDEGWQRSLTNRVVDRH